MDILDAIGNTSLVRLQRVVPPDCADIFVKLEWENPTGSMKDRMAQAVIARAEADGRLTGMLGKGLPPQDRHVRCVQP
jgi:cysteine synthase A